MARPPVLPPQPPVERRPPADVPQIGRLVEPTLRRQLAVVTLAWVFGSYWLWTISGAAMTQFARSLSMPDYGFGILGALPFLGTLLQVPASYALERFGQRKAVYLVTATLGRLMWTVAALLPWMLPNAEAWWWPAMLLSLLIAWSAAHAGVPAWMNWMSDLIPRRVRGRYFAVRNLIGQPIGLIVTLGVGYVLDQAELVQATRPDIMLKVTSAVLGIAGLVGTFDILCFRFIPDPRPPRPEKPDGFLRLLHAPLRDANFRKYLAFNFVFMLGIGFIGQYIWLYVFDVVAWSNWKANLLLIAVPLALRMGTYPMWGRLIDRLGKKPVLLVTGAVTVFGATGWLIITPERFWLGYSLVVLTVMAWPGMEIANFNFILDMAGTRRDRAPGGGHTAAAGSAYVAVNSIGVAVAGVISGLMGSVVATTLHDLAQPLPWLGIVLTYHGVLFIVSTLLRAASLVWAVGLIEPEATGTRDAIRYMTGSFYSNVRQAVLMPTRVVGRVARWSYRINGPQ